MKEVELLTWHKRPLIPTAWAVRCPGCGEFCTVDRVDEGILSEVDDIVTAFEASAVEEERYLVCEECGIGIEVIGVRFTAFEECGS